MVIDKCKCIENLIEKYREYTHCRDICLRWDNSLNIDVTRVPMKFDDADAFFAMCMGQTIYVDYQVEPLPDATDVLYDLCNSVGMPEFIQDEVVSTIVDNLDKYSNCRAFVNCLCDEMNTQHATSLVFYSPKLNATYVEVEFPEFPNQLTCDGAVEEVLQVLEDLENGLDIEKEPTLVS
jgi:hypothetical protein